MNNAATTLPTGLLFNDAAGYEANANRVIELAIEYGWEDPETDLGIIDHQDELDAMSDDETLTWKEQEATEYLEGLAPDGYYVAWHEGSFGVWPIRYKEDQFRYIINQDERGEFSASFYRIDPETGEDETEAYQEISTEDAEFLSEEGIDFRDGEMVMDYYNDLNPAGAMQYSNILAEGEESEQEDEY